MQGLSPHIFGLVRTRILWSTFFVEGQKSKTLLWISCVVFTSLSPKSRAHSDTFSSPYNLCKAVVSGEKKLTYLKHNSRTTNKEPLRSTYRNILARKRRFVITNRPVQTSVWCSAFRHYYCLFGRYFIFVLLQSGCFLVFRVFN